MNVRTRTGQARTLWFDVKSDSSSRPFPPELPLAVLGVSAIALGFVGANLRMWHWFVLPVSLCGFLIGPDAVRWMRGKYDLYDPKGLLGVFGSFSLCWCPSFLSRWTSK